MDFMQKLKQKYENFQQHGTTKNVGSSDRVWPEYKTKEGVVDNVRILLYPDGDVAKEFEILERIDVEEVEGWKWPKDNLPLCPQGNYGERSAIQEFASSLYIDENGNRIGKDEIDPESKELFRRLMPRRYWVFRVLVRGKESEGPKYFKTKNREDYEYIVGKIMDPDFFETGGFISQEPEHTAHDFKMTGKKNAGGYKMNDFDVSIKPTVLLSKDFASSFEEMKTQKTSPEELFKRISYDESKEILNNFLKGYFEEKGLERENFVKYSSSDSEEESDLDKKMKSLKEKVSK